MVAGARIVFCLVAMTVLPGAGFAQTSSVALTTRGVTPAAPLEILDSDYPLDALIANEEGETVLNLVLAETGAVRVAQIVSGSGSPDLDGRAAQIARTRWSFEPAMKDGAPVGSEARATVSWKLPLSPADEYMIGLPKPPETAVVVLPEPAAGNRFRPNDYPSVALRQKEQGLVGLTFRILANGKTSDIQVTDTSGFKSIDDGAMKYVGRWQFKPGTIDGSASDFWHATTIFFLAAFDEQPSTGLFPLPQARPEGPRAQLRSSYRPPERCWARPYVSAHDRNLKTKDGVLHGGRWWLALNDEAATTDALLHTSKGWMRVRETLLKPAAEPSSASVLPPRRTRIVGKKPSEPCWINILE